MIIKHKLTMSRTIKSIKAIFMQLNKHFSKNIITIGILSCLVGTVHANVNNPNKNQLSNNEITSNSNYYDITNLYIDKNHKIQNVTLNDETILRMYGGSLAVGTIVKDNANINMYLLGIKTIGIPTIKDTIVTGTSNIDMNAGSSSIGKLFIDKDAELYIENNDSEFANVAKNDPVSSANIYIENLTLAGTTYITPSWNEDDGDDGDAPRPEKPGPALVTRIDNLTMQSGSKFEMDPYLSGMQFNRLELKTLSGEGMFILSSSLADGISDNIYISDHATGHFGLKINDSGEEISDPKNVQLVYVNSGDADFNLLNNGGNVEIGVWKYKLQSKTNDGHTEWYLVGGKTGEPDTAKQPDITKQPDISHPATPQSILSNSAQAVINMASAPQHVLNVETGTLRQRMSFLRENNNDLGVWARYLNDDSHLNDKGYSQFHSNLNGMQIGVDKKIAINNGQLLFGLMTSYSKSKIKSDDINNGDINSYSGGVYLTWLNHSGLYLDSLFKMNHLHNEINTIMNEGKRVKGNYNQNTVTASTEIGYQIEISNTLKIMPYSQILYSHIGKSDYLLDNGMKANIHDANSLKSELGAVLESELLIAEHRVKPYIKTAISREFVKSNEIEINNISFNSNYSGNVGKYGIGFTTNIGKDAILYTEINYQNGNKLETPINATAGLKVSF